jgi:DNA-binding CsgD family transcriptional regulator
MQSNKSKKKLLIVVSCMATKIGLLNIIESIFDGEILFISNFDELQLVLNKHNISHLLIDLDNGRPIFKFNKIFKQIKIAGYTSTQKNQNRNLEILRKQDAEINHILFFKRFFSDVKKESNELSVEDTNPFNTLTSKQLEIIRLLYKGYKTKEIAEHLNLKSNTISTVKYICYNKLKVNNIAELINITNKYAVFN